MNAWTSYDRARGGGQDVHFRGVDIVIVVACSFAALALIGPASWVPGASRSALHFAIFALGPLVLRTLESYFPRHRLLGFVAFFVGAFGVGLAVIQVLRWYPY